MLFIAGKIVANVHQKSDFRNICSTLFSNKFSAPPSTKKMCLIIKHIRVSCFLVRFPADFMFELTKEEYESLRCKIFTSNKRGGNRYLPSCEIGCRIMRCPTVIVTIYVQIGVARDRNLCHFYFINTLTVFSPIFTMAVEPDGSWVFNVVIPLFAIVELSLMPLTL